jgi:hypothetical protein
MFETTQFRDQIAEAVGRETRTPLTHYETRIIDYLQDLAVGNEPVLMERELTKAAGARRGTRDALVSVSSVLSEKYIE